MISMPVTPILLNGRDGHAGLHKLTHAGHYLLCNRGREAERRLIQKQEKAHPEAGVSAPASAPWLGWGLALERQHSAVNAVSAETSLPVKASRTPAARASCEYAPNPDPTPEAASARRITGNVGVGGRTRAPLGHIDAQSSVLGVGGCGPPQPPTIDALTPRRRRAPVFACRRRRGSGSMPDRRAAALKPLRRFSRWGEHDQIDEQVQSV